MSLRRNTSAGTGFTAAQVIRRQVSLNAAKRRRAASIAKARNINGVTAQTIRVGGWANPSGGGELKYKDIAWTQTILSNDKWDVITEQTLLNGIGGGSGANQRVGRKVIMKSLMFRWSYFLNPTATTLASGGSPLRIIIFYDKQANANLPTIAGLLNSNWFNTNNNLDNRDRFVILADIYTDPVSSVGNSSVAGKRYIPLNHEVIFNGGDDADQIGSITTGSIFVTFAQDGGLSTPQTVGQEGAFFKFNSRIRYEDK